MYQVELLIRQRRVAADLHEAAGWKDREEKLAMPLDTSICVRSMTKPVVGNRKRFPSVVVLYAVSPSMVFMEA